MSRQDEPAGELAVVRGAQIVPAGASAPSDILHTSATGRAGRAGMFKLPTREQQGCARSLGGRGKELVDPPVTPQCDSDRSQARFESPAGVAREHLEEKACAGYARPLTGPVRVGSGRIQGTRSPGGRATPPDSKVTAR